MNQGRQQAETGLGASRYCHRPCDLWVGRALRCTPPNGKKAQFRWDDGVQRSARPTFSLNEHSLACGRLAGWRLMEWR